MPQPDGIKRFVVFVNGMYIAQAYTNTVTFAPHWTQAQAFDVENTLNILKFVLAMKDCRDVHILEAL